MSTRPPTPEAGGVPDLVMYRPAALERWVLETLTTVGVSTAQSTSVASALVQADQRGTHTHGVEMLPRYVKGYRGGFLNGVAAPKRVTGTVALARWDGDNGLGHYVCDVVADAVAAAAHEHGIAVASIFNSNHFGIAARYAMRLAEDGMIAMVTTNTPAVMGLSGSSPGAIIGNNPLAWAVPREGHDPLVLDMAVSATARGKVRLAASAGAPIPIGWAVDAQGRDTDDPVKALSGTLLPLAGVKGYGLAVINELLAGALSGAHVLGEISTRTITAGDLHDTWGIGHFLLAINPVALIDRQVFADRVERVAGQLIASQGVMLPGSPEFRMAHARREWLPMPSYIAAALNQLADEVGVSPLTPADEEGDAE